MGSFRRFLLLAVGVSLAAACGPPQEVGEHLRRGDAALDAGRFGEAMVAYARARELAPEDPGVQRSTMRARIYMIASDPSRLQHESLDEARYDAQALLESDPAHKAVYLTALANVASHAGNREEAKAKLEEAVKADPKSAIAHAALGTLLLEQKETVAQAKEELTAALGLKPDDRGALLGMSQAKVAEGDLTGAAALLVSALKVRDDFGTRMALGGIYEQQQKHNEAAEQFQHAALLDPKSADALSQWGRALVAANRAVEAERALRSALELRKDTDTSVALGLALVKENKADEASELFAKLLAHEPTSAAAHYGAGMAAEALGKNDEAATHYWAVLAKKAAEGPDKKALAGVQADAQKRLAAIQADAEPPAASASPSASPSAAPSAAPSARPSAAPSAAPGVKPGASGKP
jgi:tetratricopeptide (TPR) repeat protein